MTLLEMAQFVADKVRRNDAASQARCKLYLRRRYEMIWNEGLWRSSVYRHDFTIQPASVAELPFANQWCNAAGIQNLPPSVDRVLALRRQDAGVRVEMAESLYRCGVDEFEQEGVPMKFLVLAPAAVGLERFTPAQIESPGVGVALEADAADATKEIRIKCIDTDGAEQEETVTISGTDPNVMTNRPLVILSATKAEWEADVRFVFGDNADLLFTLGAGATAARRFPRIQLLPKPTADTAFKVLVKKKPTVLSDDRDEPELTGLENCLMSFAQADMLQHSRHYAKAAEVQKEALGLLEQFKRMELIQMASRQQVVPDVVEQTGDFLGDKGWYA